MAKFAFHMGDPHGDPQISPQHADPHGFLVFFKKAPSPCGSACCGLVCGSPCGLPTWVANLAMAGHARKVTEQLRTIINRMVSKNDVSWGKATKAGVHKDPCPVSLMNPCRVHTLGVMPLARDRKCLHCSNFIFWN